MPSKRKKSAPLDVWQLGKSLVDKVTGSVPGTEPATVPEHGINTDELLAHLHKPRKNGTAKAVTKRKPKAKKAAKKK
jgi:hypothetical protein